MDINDATAVWSQGPLFFFKVFYHGIIFFLMSYYLKVLDLNLILYFAWCKVVEIFAKYNDILVDEKITAKRNFTTRRSREAM